jgi:hypothetical protein
LAPRNEIVEDVVQPSKLISRHRGRKAPPPFHLPVFCFLCIHRRAVAHISLSLHLCLAIALGESSPLPSPPLPSHPSSFSPLVRRTNAAGTDANNPTILTDEWAPRSGGNGRQGHRGHPPVLRRRKAAAFPHRRHPCHHSIALLAQEPMAVALLRRARRRGCGRPCRRGGGAGQLGGVAALLGGAGHNVLGPLRPRTRLVHLSLSLGPPYC